MLAMTQPESAASGSPAGAPTGHAAPFSRSPCHCMPELAAPLGTAGELVLPVLLVLGLGGRLAAAGLFVVNVVAVLSLAEIAEAALQQHVFWGSLLLGLVLWGPGRWSVDTFIWRRGRRQ